MAFGVESGWKSVSAADADCMMRTALDSGINFYDTAPNCGNGTSEERLGKVFKTLDREAIRGALVAVDPLPVAINNC